MPIQVLSPDLVSKIAAGEVIERPASVVKELIENSLDAGASQITVEVRGGGITLLRVTDNGCGIPAGEVDVAFQRHATSKITSLEDLEKISSLGFRGEALPSIASVSLVELFTQTADDAAGAFLSLKGGEVIERMARGRPRGATITVRNLFYNVPARRKFLKSWATESSHISAVVSEYALAYPEVRFTLYIESRVSLRTPGSGSLRDAAVELYGLELAQELIEIAPNDQDVSPKVGGLIGPPQAARSNRGYMSFFLNRRWIRSPVLAYAVEEAYHGLLMTGRHPVAILNITLDPTEVDVNVHPTKAEVRFRNEHIVFAAAQKAVRAALVARMPVPQMEVPAAAPLKLSPLPIQGVLKASPSGDDNSVDSLFPSPTSHIRPPTSQIPILRVLGQVSNCYIIAEGPEGVYLIDQHAAHERVLFEKVHSQRARQQVEEQGLLEPFVLEVSPQQQDILNAEVDNLKAYGFALEPFGDKSFLVRSIPAVLATSSKNSGQGLAEALKEIADALAEGRRTGWEERIEASLACHGAVKAGQSLDPEEMRELVRLLEKAAMPRTCPHGRPTMVHLSASQLEKEFGRR
ncbi:MAG: DNA mismatch repair endonuclease MutL [Chloroflexi bacterium]|nr:DNA mismatch repair endonuclease MutL [Chloroflexota bacterium]